MTPEAIRHYLGQFSGFDLPAMDDDELEQLAVALLGPDATFAYPLRLVRRLAVTLLEAQALLEEMTGWRDEALSELQEWESGERVRGEAEPRPEEIQPACNACDGAGWTNGGERGDGSVGDETCCACDGTGLEPAP